MQIYVILMVSYAENLYKFLINPLGFIQIYILFGIGFNVGSKVLLKIPTFESNIKTI